MISYFLKMLYFLFSTIVSRTYGFDYKQNYYYCYLQASLFSALKI